MLGSSSNGDSLFLTITKYLLDLSLSAPEVLVSAAVLALITPVLCVLFAARIARSARKLQRTNQAGTREGENARYDDLSVRPVNRTMWDPPFFSGKGEGKGKNGTQVDGPKGAQ